MKTTNVTKKNMTVTTDASPKANPLKAVLAENTAAKKRSARDLKSLAKKAAIEAKAAAKKSAEPISAFAGARNVLGLVADIAAKNAPKAAVAPAPAKAAKPAKAPKAPKAPAEAVLKVRLYAKGEFYFGRHVAARMEGMTHVAVEANGRKVTLTPTKSTKDTFPLMYCHKAPVLRVKEALKDLGIVTVATQDLVAKPVGETAFTVEVK